MIRPRIAGLLPAAFVDGIRSSSVAMDNSVKYGLGVTTPNETAALFELLARGRGEPRGLTARRLTFASAARIT